VLFPEAPSSEVITLGSETRASGEGSVFSGAWAPKEGKTPTTRRQRYDRDARYAAIPVRRSSAL
jgi:hypothetical protein